MYAALRSVVDGALRMQSTAEQEGLQPGTVERLNLSAGFGYVRDATGEFCYIFVVGTALTHADARRLVVGKHVKFRLSGGRRVEEVVVL